MNSDDKKQAGNIRRARKYPYMVALRARGFAPAVVYESL